MMRPSTYAFDPAQQLVDQNIQVATSEGIVRGQIDDTTLYLNTTPAWQALFNNQMYGSYAVQLMQPPADENGTAVYTDEYHEQVTLALRRLPRWSMLWGDSGDTTGNTEHPLNLWELDDDPKPLTTAASAMAQTIQAIGLFGPLMPSSELVDGVAVSLAEVSKVDPLLVSAEAVSGAGPALAYASARYAMAPELADITAAVGKTKKPMPAHQSVLKAHEDEATSSQWMAKQVDPEHRATPADVLGEIEFKLMVLRQVQLQQAQKAIDDAIVLLMRQAANQGGPVETLALLDTHIRQAAAPVAAPVQPLPTVEGG